MPDRFSEARTGNIDRVFKNEVLILLERIAVALENPQQTIEFEPRTLDQPQQPTFNRNATVCSCGSDARRACNMCTPARLAWFYDVNPEYRP